MQILGGIFALLMSFGWAQIGSWLTDGSIFRPQGLLFFGIPCVVVALIALFVIYDGFSNMSNHAYVEQIKANKAALPPENVTASELLANKIRADNLYRDRRLNVTGRITDIVSHPNMLPPYDLPEADIILDGIRGNSNEGLKCEFRRSYDVTGVSIGQTVTISGTYKYTNCIGDCKVNKIHPSQQNSSSTPQSKSAKSSNPVFDSILSRASAGNAKAQFELSQAYFEGKIVGRNDNEGLKWLEKSAENDYPDALFELGGMYLNGFLVKQDLEKGQYYMKKAAALGHEKAKFIVSLTESMMIPKPSMPDEEYASIRQKATNGDPEAQYKLGMFYFEELHDNKEAVRWFFKAAQQGHSEANIKMQIIFKADPDLWSWFMNNPDERN